MITAEDWAPYGIGEPDADGWYPDYRPVPEDLKPARADVTVVDSGPDVDRSLLGLLTNWQLVVADLAQHFGLDLYDPVVRARPWPGVRTMIFSLLDSPTRLRAVLTQE